MYYPVEIGKLSKVQKLNLLKGKNVRIKKGTASTLHLTEDQIKKLEKNHKLGKKYTVKLSQDQIAKTGSGIFSDAYAYIKRTPFLKSAANAAIRGGKKYAHQGIDYLAEKAKNKISSIPEIGSGLRRRKRRGAGILGTIFKGASELSNIIGGPGSREASSILNTIGSVGNELGYGLKRNATPKQLEHLAKIRAIKLEKLLASGKQPKRKTFGPKKRATTQQLANLALGRQRRAANLLKKRGGALYPGGY